MIILRGTRIRTDPGRCQWSPWGSGRTSGRWCTWTSTAAGPSRTFRSGHPRLSWDRSVWKQAASSWIKQGPGFTIQANIGRIRFGLFLGLLIRMASHELALPIKFCVHTLSTVVEGIPQPTGPNVPKGFSLSLNKEVQCFLIGCSILTNFLLLCTQSLPYLKQAWTLSGERKRVSKRMDDSSHSNTFIWTHVALPMTVSTFKFSKCQQILANGQLTENEVIYKPAQVGSLTTIEFKLIARSGDERRGRKII